MKIIPVLDILNQTVVRGVAGQRDAYRPIKSRLTGSNQPVEIANALRDEYGFSEFYVADLDAIQQGKLNLDLYSNLREADFTILLDCGISNASDSCRLNSIADLSIVAGLETLAAPQELGKLVEQWGVQQTVFSLDLKQGIPLVNQLPENEFALIADPFKIAELSIQQGIQQIILLDLAHVGMGDGTGTERLCQSLHRRHPDLKLITGGGVRNRDDLVAQAELGADGILVASALHDGRIRREDVLSLS